MDTRAVDDYLRLPYHIEVVRDDSDDHPGWFARVVELPGCMTQADTLEELGAMIEDAMRGWIEIGIEDGQAIPEPRAEESYSGKFVVRLPKSLHRQLVEAAEREGISLNAHVSVALATAVSEQRPMGAQPVADTAPVPIWPRLKPNVRQALVAAGLYDRRIPGSRIGLRAPTASGRRFIHRRQKPGFRAYRSRTIGPGRTIA